jgi:nucleoside phosphorylase
LETTIGLIAAMTQESNALLHRVQGAQHIAVGDFRGYRFQINSQTCVLVTSGMGVRHAAGAARTLINRYQPQALISFGIAGAVEPDLEIGDVVAVEAYCRLEAGSLTAQQPLAKLPEQARASITRALAQCNARLFTGSAVTTTGSQLAQSEAGGLEHPVLEMETAGIAIAARQEGIPLFCLRSISDGPRDQIPLDLGEIMDEDANLQMGKMLLAIIRHPGAILQGGRMMRNTRLASEHAALSVLAALAEWPLQRRAISS